MGRVWEVVVVLVEWLEGCLEEVRFEEAHEKKGILLVGARGRLLGYLV